MMYLSDCDVCSLESVQSLVYVFDWQLQEEVDGLADRVELANNALKGDWSRWQNSLRTDLKSAFISTAEKNVDYYEKVSSRFRPKKTLFDVIIL